MKNQNLVRTALDKVRQVKHRIGGQVPKLDAFEAILNADLHDRQIGLTFEPEETPGLRLARRVRV